MISIFENVYVMVGLVIVLFAMALIIPIYQRDQLKRYESVSIGMSEAEMLQIMGGGYNKSSLKNNRNKYEWRINATSYGKNGFRAYSGVRKVDIYTKDGRVEEIRPYNVR